MLDNYLIYRRIKDYRSDVFSGKDILDRLANVYATRYLWYNLPGHDMWYSRLHGFWADTYTGQRLPSSAVKRRANDVAKYLFSHPYQYLGRKLYQISRNK